MNLDLLNNIFNNERRNNFAQSFMKELSNHVGKQNSKEVDNTIETGALKQENCLYQVVELDTDGAYLQNINNNIVSKETDISDEVLESIGNDFVLKYQNGEYVVEEELTGRFFDSLVDIKEYKEIQDKFIKESNILEIEQNTRYKIKTKDKNYCILSYGNNINNTIKVPNELIPFWANSNENLYYKNGKFNRDI